MSMLDTDFLRISTAGAIQNTMRPTFVQLRDVGRVMIWVNVTNIRSIRVDSECVAAETFDDQFLFFDGSLSDMWASATIEPVD